MTRHQTCLLGFFVATLYMTAASAKTHHVCIGENSGPDRGPDCPQNQVYAYRHTPIGIVAAQLCIAENSSSEPTEAAP
jgi:hypothetical protein